MWIQRTKTPFQQIMVHLLLSLSTVAAGIGRAVESGFFPQEDRLDSPFDHDAEDMNPGSFRDDRAAMHEDYHRITDDIRKAYDQYPNK